MKQVNPAISTQVYTSDMKLGIARAIEWTANRMIDGAWQNHVVMCSCSTWDLNPLIHAGDTKRSADPEMGQNVLINVQTVRHMASGSMCDINVEVRWHQVWQARQQNQTIDGTWQKHSIWPCLPLLASKYND